MKTYAFRVSGRVQGVSFRMATRQQATMYGIGGWVRNCPDGTVEGMATGEEALLEEFRAWLQHGPALAKVTKLDWEERPPQEFDRFEVR